MDNVEAAGRLVQLARSLMGSGGNAVRTIPELNTRADIFFYDREYGRPRPVTREWLVWYDDKGRPIAKIRR